MSGRRLVLLLLGFAILFGAALWYFQTRAFYRELEPGTVRLTLTQPDGRVVSLPAVAVEAIDSGSSPLKFRACFRMTGDLADFLDRFQTYPRAEPLVAPGWFDCFDAAAIARDLEAGRAAAFVGAWDIAPGADRIVAIYPDGRGYAWHQLTEEFAEN